ncbi:hypothetical protein [Loktanella sp. Alg231-35]|uniref:hypothetical protein n=1 Tax=Loktanella sp. Alg231-35 TaxID=1922220 RepID=UPI000D55C035|nr:hypothetical protein [Loktanella sp. Alg231-35]
MPLNRLIILLALVIAAAAGTLYLALSIVGALQLPPPLGIAGLSILALCAAVALRRMTRH